MMDGNWFGEFDTTGVEKMGGYEVYPPGDYPAIMISASKKMTKNQDGMYVECVYQFIEGDHAGKRFTSRMNLQNSNQQAVDIAKRELKSLRAALGLADNAGDLNLFVNKPLVLRLNAKPRKNEPSVIENNLIAIEPYGSQVANPAPAYQPQPQPTAPQFAAPGNGGWAPQPTPGTAAPPNYTAPGTAPQMHPGMMQTPPAFAPANGQPAPWQR